MESEELASKCGAYCFSAMKPVLGYVKTHQHQLENCQKGTQPDVGQINQQLSDVKQTLDNLKKSLDSKQNNNVEAALLNRLGNIEKDLQAVRKENEELQTKLYEIQNALYRKATGSKLYILDQNSTDSCGQIGGHLVTIKDNNDKFIDFKR
ncbi:hypothetical protein KR054_008211 [Drosophila jambulina]|nr:hypothetical protein KR054_008211 [Drosophila jambulina]